MFERPDESYIVSDDQIDGIINDIANPLTAITSFFKKGSRILDLGAGNGNLARVSKKLLLSVEIDGVEPNAIAASLAKPYYKRMYVGYAEEIYENLNIIEYDYIVLADVLEHIADPFVFLNNLVGKLNEKQKVIISIPNVLFGGLRLSIMNGNFNYVDSGLLEKTHLRFFTRETIVELFKRVNLFPSNIFYLQRSFYRVEFPQKVLKASLFSIIKLSLSEDARAYQYVICFEKTPSFTKVYYKGIGFYKILVDYILFTKPVRFIVRLIKKYK